jgi:hypothetical protein
VIDVAAGDTHSFVNVQELNELGFK